jgi:hypothetical protein
LSPTTFESGESLLRWHAVAASVGLRGLPTSPTFRSVRQLSTYKTYRLGERYYLYYAS